MLDSTQQVWGLHKHESIKHLLILLFGHFEGRELVAEVDGLCNEQAVCLVRRDDRSVRVYIYTYGHVAGQYGMHIEYPIIPAPYALTNPISYEDLSFDQVIELIETHLNIV